MGKQKENKIVLTGQILIKLGEKNLNNHVYLDNDNLREMIEEYNERAKTFGGFGELGYPENFEVAFNNVSHTVRNLRIENDAVVGDVEVFENNNAGRTLASLIGQCVFRPRATGKVLENGEVVLDKIFAFDAINKQDDAFQETSENLTESRPVL